MVRHFYVRHFQRPRAQFMSDCAQNAIKSRRATDFIASVGHSV